MAGSKPLLTDFGIHYILESCVIQLAFTFSSYIHNSLINFVKSVEVIRHNNDYRLEMIEAQAIRWC